MSLQSTRTSVYTAYSSIASTIEVLLKIDDVEMMKDGLRGLLRHCRENAIPISEKKKLINKRK